MVLEIEYCGPIGSNQPENLQNLIIKVVSQIFKSTYRQKMFDSNLDNHGQMFDPYSADCEYQSEIRARHEDLGMTAVCHATLVKNHYKIQKFEKKWIGIFKK